MHMRGDAIADSLPLTQPFDQAGVSQDAKVVRDMGLRPPEFPDEIRYAFVMHQEQLQDSEASAVTDGAQDTRALPSGQYRVGHKTSTQQQPPFGEQFMGVPATVWPARLMMAK